MRTRRAWAVTMVAAVLAGCSGTDGPGSLTRQAAEMITPRADGQPVERLAAALSPIHASCARLRATDEASQALCVGYDDASVHQVWVATGPDGGLQEVRDELLSRTDIPGYDNGNVDTSSWDASRRRMAEAFEQATGSGLDVDALFTDGRPGSHHQETAGDWTVVTWTHSSTDARFMPTFRAQRSGVEAAGKKLRTLAPVTAWNSAAMIEAATAKGWECSDSADRKACWTSGRALRIEGEGTSRLELVQDEGLPAWPQEDELVRAAMPPDLADRVAEWAQTQQEPASLAVIDQNVVVLERYGSQLETARGGAVSLSVGYRPELVPRRFGG